MEPKGNGGAQRNVEKGIEGYSKTAHQAVDRAAEAAASMAGRLGERAEALGMKGEELLEMRDQWMESAREYVREHPVQALGIAVAAGYLLSMMMRSK
ncbi:MAG TPA: DUF883 C-terminal domain-containing protein [Burkholderiales bacterium]|nr:DUF883 C-terminal domain-containing protein [Burkholderiales bacterium]